MSGGEAPGLPTHYVYVRTCPPAGYTPTYVPHVYACARCGGAVADVDVHDAWHDGMRNAVRMAYYAAPLGPSSGRSQFRLTRRSTDGGRP